MQGEPFQVIETSLGKIRVYECSQAKPTNIDNLYELLVRLLMEESKDAPKINRHEA